jgi:hypothetical protein
MNWTNLRRAIAARCRTATSQQLTAPYLRIVIWAGLGILWAPLVVILFAVPMAARAAALAEGFQVPGLLLTVSLFLSTLAGITALLIRVERELSAAPDQPLPRPMLFCFAHMSGSWLAGTLAFIINQAQELNVWYGLGLVIGASFIGAKFVELWAEKVVLSRAPSRPAGGTP